GIQPSGWQTASGRVHPASLASGEYDRDELGWSFRSNGECRQFLLFQAPGRSIRTPQIRGRSIRETARFFYSPDPTQPHVGFVGSSPHSGKSPLAALPEWPAIAS